MSDDESFHSVSDGEEEVDEKKVANKLVCDKTLAVGNARDQVSESHISPPQIDSEIKDDKCDANERVVQVESPIGEWDDWRDKPDESALETENVDGWDDWDVDELVTPSETAPKLPTLSDPPAPDIQPTKTQLPTNSIEQRPASLWGNWNSILSVASDSLNTFTSSVGEGLSTVLETVETSIGAPTPEDLAKLSLAERALLEQKVDKVKEPLPDDVMDDCDSAEEGGSDSGGVSEDNGSSLLSGVTSVFETTGKTLLSGGLDVLETLGKKTFSALTETDQQTQRRRFILQQDNPTLSSALKELQAKHQAEAVSLQQEREARKCNFSYLFDHHQGMVNLEALEMLSGNCKRQLPQLTPELSELQTPFDQLDSQDISHSFGEDADGDFVAALRDMVKDLDLPVNVQRITEARRRHVTLSKQMYNQDPKTVNEKGMDCLAEMTACCVELLHKTSQLILVCPQLPSAHILIEVCECLCCEITHLSTLFSDCVKESVADNVNEVITGLFFEASNSVTYVRQACQLMLPVLQLRTNQLHST